MSQDQPVVAQSNNPDIQIARICLEFKLLANQYCKRPRFFPECQETPTDAIALSMFVPPESKTCL
jgi:hypothetical protein